MDILRATASKLNMLSLIHSFVIDNKLITHTMSLCNTLPVFIAFRLLTTLSLIETTGCVNSAALYYITSAEVR